MSRHGWPSLYVHVTASQLFPQQLSHARQAREVVPGKVVFLGHLVDKYLAVSLFQAEKFLMGLRLIMSEQDTVPGGPLLVFVPPDRDEVIEVIPGREDGLVAPDVLNEVAQVVLLYQEANIATILHGFLRFTQSFKHDLVVSVVFSLSAIILNLCAVPTAANIPGVGGNVELCAWLVVAAAVAVVDVLTQSVGVLGHLE